MTASRWATVDFPADCSTEIDEATHELVTTNRPNPQVAINAHRAIRRFLGLPVTTDEWRVLTDPAAAAAREAEAQRRAAIAESLPPTTPRCATGAAVTAVTPSGPGGPASGARGGAGRSLRYMATADLDLVIDPQKLAEVLRGPQGPVARRLLEDGELVKNEAKRLVGVGKRDPWGRPKDRPPGTLRDSIIKRLRPLGGSFTVEVGSEDPIALLHHEGTVPHTIAARNAPRLVFWKGGTVVYARQVHHPGTKPNRYLTNALAVLRGRY